MEPQNWDAEAVETFGREVEPVRAELPEQNWNWEDIETIGRGFPDR